MGCNHTQADPSKSQAWVKSLIKLGADELISDTKDELSVNKLYLPHPSTMTSHTISSVDRKLSTSALNAKFSLYSTKEQQASQV